MEKLKAIIEVIKIKKSFGDLRTLKDVSLSLGKNQIVTLLGPSGCGNIDRHSS